MNRELRGITCLLMLFGLAGCAETAGVSKLVYAKNLTVGINVSTTGANPDFTIGMRSQNLAIVPVYSEANEESILGNVGGQDATDAFSVLGQFSTDASGTKVSLGEFFATGLAAQKLADGFACQLGYCLDSEDDAEEAEEEAEPEEAEPEEIASP